VLFESQPDGLEERVHALPDLHRLGERSAELTLFHMLAKGEFSAALTEAVKIRERMDALFQTVRLGLEEHGIRIA